MMEWFQWLQVASTRATAGRASHVVRLSHAQHIDWGASCAGTSSVRCATPKSGPKANYRGNARVQVSHSPTHSRLLLPHLPPSADFAKKPGEQASKLEPIVDSWQTSR